VSHMVIFQTPDGNPGYKQFESVGEAVAFVETLRNDQGIENARMFALEEIKFDLRPYFKVQLQALNAGAPAPSSTAPAQPAPAQPAPAQPEPAPTPAPSQPSPAPAAGEPTTFGTFAPPASSAPSSSPESAPSAPTPPADQPSTDSQPARRGLFGR